VVRSYNRRGTAEQWIKEGKHAVKWTKRMRKGGVSCALGSGRDGMNPGSVFLGKILAIAPSGG
jgi:hypothetical protein